MPKVLLITTAYPPPGGGGTGRIMRMLKWLPLCGWDVTLLTVSRVPLPTSAERLTEDSANVYRVPCQSRWIGRSASAATSSTVPSAGGRRRAWCPSGLKRFLRRIQHNLAEFPDRMRSWIGPGVRLGRRLLAEGAFDVIYSSAGGGGVSGHFIAARLQREVSLPWIHEYRDLWPRNPWRSIEPYWWRDRLEIKWERRFLWQASRVVVMHERIGDILWARHLSYPRSRVHVIPNGYDASEFPPNSGAPAALPLRLCHTGSLYGGKRDVSGLCLAIKRLADRGVISAGQLEFTHAGPGGYLVLQVAANIGATAFVRDSGQITASDAKRLQLGSHILVLPEMAGDDPWVRANMPGKAYEYLAARRPVLALAAPDGSIAELYRTTQAGTTLAPGDVEGISSYLQGAIELLAAGRLPNYNADPAAVRLHSWEMIARDLSHLLEQARTEGNIRPY